MLMDLEAESYIATQLENYVHCPVILTNQTAPVPSYPYISYTITTPVHHAGGTYCMREGVYYQPMLQTWSLTAHSDDSRACQQLGMKMYDFFARVGRQSLYQEQIAVSGKTDLMQRDNLLTIQFEYRCGMDVIFRLMHRLDIDEGKIEQATVQHQMLYSTNHERNEK